MTLRGSSRELNPLTRRDAAKEMQVWGPQGVTGLPGGSAVKNLPASAGDTGLTPGSGRSPEEEMATCSPILSWTIPWTEE